MVRVLLAILLAAAAPAVHLTKADMSAAKASVLTKAELGKGWTGKASPQTGASFDCKGYAPSGAGITESGGATSDTFAYGTTGIGPFLVQATSVYATKKQANTYWSRAVTPKLLTCAVQTLRLLSAKGVSVTITKSSKLAFQTTVPHAAEYRVVGDLGKNKLKSYLDVIVLQDGRAISEITITSIEVAPPVSFEEIVAHDVIKNLGGTAD